jgi:gliding motility-associated-like protein
MFIISSYLKRFYSILHSPIFTYTYMKFILLLLISFVLFFTAGAQDFSNKGKDFWVGYGSHVNMYGTGGADPAGGGTQEMVLYFTSDVTANVTITIPSTGWTRNYVVPANSVVESQSIPKTGADDVRLRKEGKFSKKSIHITSDKPIVAYAHIYNSAVSGATLLFPTNTLGKEYYSLNYKQTSNSPWSYPYVFAIATEDSTIIEVTPTAATQTHAANVTFRDTLMKGDVINLLGQITNGGGSTGVDLTGTKIKSVASSTGQCKRIAVFSGSGKLDITCPSGTSGSADNYIAQVFPSTAWGQKYFTAPTKGLPNNYFRVLVKDPTTVVKLNGVVQTVLVNNFYYDLPITNAASVIESDKPVLVAQYITTTGSCGNTHGGLGDPEMIYLSPIEQTIDKVTLNSTSHFAIVEHYINIIIKTSAASTFRIDGAIPASTFVPYTQDPTYSYTQISVGAGSHTIQADSGFNAIAYGYGSPESYGYNAGTNIRDLYNFVTPINPLNISNQNTACAGTPFFFSITYPFQPTSLYWDFHNFQTPNVTITNPIIDTNYFINGKQIWRYKLPTTYTYSPAGNYPVSVTAGTSGSDGCGNLQTRDDTLFVFDPPVTDITWTHSGCPTDTVFFKDNTNYVTGTFSYKWYWDFGDGSKDNVRNPKHQYLAPGVYTVRFALTSNVGCLSDTASKQITITSAPIARFGISSPRCLGKAITFSDSSFSPPPGNLVTWIWDFGDGATQTLTASSNPTHVYSSAGTFNATLKVINNTNCQSLLFTKQVTVYPNPIINFNLPGICLPSGLAQFFDSSSIADGTQSLFTYLWNFGDAASVGLNNSLINGCISDTTKILSTVYAQPKAAFTVKAENCLNDTTYFTDQSNGQGSAVTNWFWNFGDGQSSTLQNPTHLYASAGTYTISLYSKTDKGCISDTATKQVIINSLPTVSFATSTPACETKNVTFTNASAANSGILTMWNWNLGDGTLLTPANDNPFTHTYASAGNYTVTLSVESDKGCKSPVLSRQIIINAQPLPGFVSPSVCLTDAFAQFTDTSKIAAGTITTWAWNFDDASSGALNTSALQNPKHKYNATGIYNVTLTVTSNNGCVATLTKAFTVNGAIPKANFSVLNSTGLCSNTDVQLQNTSTVDFGNITKVEIYWDLTNNPATFDADANPTPNKIYTHLYTNFQTPLTKTFQVKFRSYSGINCVDEITKNITVNASPKVQFLPISDTCFNINPFAITQASEIGGVPGTGAFSGPGITGSNIFDPSVAGVGTHTIRYTFTSNAGCVNYQDQTIMIYPIVNVNAGPDRTVLEAATITLEPIVTGNALQYLWTPNQYLNDATILSPTVLGVQDITYTLSVTGTGGCIFSDQVFVKVLKFPNIPNTFTPNNDGINDTWIIDHLADYPNVRVQVFNRYGQLVFESKGYSKPWDGTMNGKSLPFGTYYYVIEPGNGRNPVTGYVTLIK